MLILVCCVPVMLMRRCADDRRHRPGTRRVPMSLASSALYRSLFRAPKLFPAFAVNMLDVMST